MTPPRCTSGRVTGQSDRTPACCGCGWPPAPPAPWRRHCWCSSLLTKATGQPLTVALLGALITMVSARSVNEPDPRRQRITMALLPLPTALAIIAAALVAPHPVIGDVLFVVVVFVAAYARRFGPRGTALGMVTFMSYFFSLYLRAQFSELPWLIGATVVGTLCSFIWSTFICPTDRKAFCGRTFGRFARGWRSSSTPPPTPCGSATPTSGDSVGCASGHAGSTKRR